MKTIIFNPKPYVNDYLSEMYLIPVGKALKYTFIDRIDEIERVCDSVVLLNGIYLTPTLVELLKDNGNKIVSFDINDDAHMTEAYGGFEQMDKIDLIFKVSGLQIERESYEIFIDKDINYSAHKVPFCNDEQWSIYSKMRDAGRIRSLPYVLWKTIPIHNVPYCEKDRNVLIRGGNHYFRFHLFLNLLRHGLIDSGSSFCTNEYFKNTMSSDHKYCPECLDTRKQFGKIPYEYYKSSKKFKCNNSKIKWGGEVSDNFFNENSAFWHNRCIPMFYWLSEQFEKTHGFIDKNLLENALNGTFIDENSFHSILSKYKSYADFKWNFTIYVPPRFWESAAFSAVNVVSSRINDQIFFPEMREGDHYITFKEDFTDIEKSVVIDKYLHDHITEETRKLYESYIIPDKNIGINRELLSHIRRGVEDIKG